MSDSFPDVFSREKRITDFFPLAVDPYVSLSSFVHKATVTHEVAVNIVVGLKHYISDSVNEATIADI